MICDINGLEAKMGNTYLNFKTTKPQIWDEKTQKESQLRGQLVFKTTAARERHVFGQDSFLCTWGLIKSKALSHPFQTAHKEVVKKPNCFIPSPVSPSETLPHTGDAHDGKLPGKLVRPPD